MTTISGVYQVPMIQWTRTLSMLRTAKRTASPPSTAPTIRRPLPPPSRACRSADGSFMSVSRPQGTAADARESGCARGRDAPAATAVRATGGSAAQDPSLLGRELLVGEDSLLLQGGQLLELLDAILTAGSSRRSRSRGLRVLLRRVGGLLLVAPALSLAPAHPVRDRGGGSGDDRGAGDTAKQSWHWVLLSVSSSPRWRRARRSLPARGCAGGPAPAGRPPRSSARRPGRRSRRCRWARSRQRELPWQPPCSGDPAIAVMTGV